MAAIDKLPSGRWRARYRAGPNGPRYSQTFRTRSAAVAWAREHEAEVERGIIRDPRSGDALFGEWYKEWLKSRVVEDDTADRNARHARLYLLPEWKGWPVKAISRFEVQQWVARLHAAGVGAQTIRSTVNLLSSVMQVALENRMTTENPARGISLPTVSPSPARTLTRDEQHRLLAAMPELYRPLVLLALTSGARWAELAGLTVDRLDLDAGRVTILEVARRNGTVKGHPKGKRERYIPLPDDVVRALQDHLDSLPAAAAEKAPGRVFVTVTGRPVSYNVFRTRIFAPAVVRAEIPNPQPTFHDLRHTYATMLANAGVPQHIIMERLGHRDTRTTNKYLHASNGDDQVVLDALRRQRE